MSPFSVCVLIQLLSHIQLFCNPLDCPLESSVYGIFQARILEWVAIFYSRGSSRPRDQTHISYLQAWQVDSPPLCPLGRSTFPKFGYKKKERKKKKKPQTLIVCLKEKILRLKKHNLAFRG